MFYHNWHERVPVKLSRGYRLVLIVLFSLVGISTVWAVTAPIGGAFLSQGRVVAEGKNRVVEHLEGGIVEEVMVREGDRVEAGQVLGQVDTANAQAKLASAQMQRDIARIRLARFLAERDEAEMVVPEDIAERAETETRLQQAIATQQQEYADKLREIQSLEEILEARIQTNEDLLVDLEELVEDQRARIASTQEELAVSTEMLEKGLTTRDRNFALRRQVASDQDQLRSTVAQIAERKSQIAQTKEQLSRALSQRANEVSEEIIALRSQVFELRENIQYYSQVAGRSRVIAPVSGIIVNVATNTQDEVIAPGEALFEIFPDDLPLAIEARVEPQFIDSVYVNQEAAMQFQSRDRSRSVKNLRGTVTFVSSDSEQDERTGMF
ncbi:MAG: HlyD family type I secretion periplasmic adaptor subunit, partial [Pseudomonadota bacterium]